MIPVAVPPAAARLSPERDYPLIDPHAREILSLLLADPGAFHTALEIARHTDLPVAEVRRTLGALVWGGHVGSGWYVTDAGRDALAEESR